MRKIIAAEMVTLNGARSAFPPPPERLSRSLLTHPGISRTPRGAAQQGSRRVPDSTRRRCPAAVRRVPAGLTLLVSASRTAQETCLAHWAGVRHARLASGLCIVACRCGRWRPRDEPARRAAPVTTRSVLRERPASAALVPWARRRPRNPPRRCANPHPARWESHPGLVLQALARPARHGPGSPKNVRLVCPSGDRPFEAVARAARAPGPHGSLTKEMSCGRSWQG